MGARTAAREAALQMLFSADLGSHPADAAVQNFWREFPGDPEGRAYADAAVRGVLAERERVDERVRKASQNWRLERMTAIDRNVLRLGTWELLYRPDVPRAVIIDESVEIAKRFGGKESAAFVNGVLDRIADDCGRKDEPKKSGKSQRPGRSRVSERPPPARVERSAASAPSAEDAAAAPPEHAAAAPSEHSAREDDAPEADSPERSSSEQGSPQPDDDAPDGSSEPRDD